MTEDRRARVRAALPDMERRSGDGVAKMHPRLGSVRARAWWLVEGLDAAAARAVGAVPRDQAMVRTLSLTVDAAVVASRHQTQGAVQSCLSAGRGPIP